MMAAEIFKTATHFGKEDKKNETDLVAAYISVLD